MGRLAEEQRRKARERDASIMAFLRRYGASRICHIARGATCFGGDPGLVAYRLGKMKEAGLVQSGMYSGCRFRKWYLTEKGWRQWATEGQVIHF